MLDDPFARRLPDLRAQVDARLADLLTAGAGAPSVLRDAVRYALLSPGKRLRPVLAVLAAEHFGLRRARRRAAGCGRRSTWAAPLRWCTPPR